MSVASATLVAGVLTPTPRAEAAQATATTLAVVNVRSGPGTGYSVLKQIGNGQRIGINCWKPGTAVTGPYGTSTIWYSVEGVSNGWITDALIYTGRNSAVTPQCGASTPASTSLGAKVDAFVARWRGGKADFDGYYGAQCVDLTNFYVRDVLKKPFIPVSYAYQTYSAASTAHYTKLARSAVPQKGDIVVWGTGIGSAGHIAIVLRNIDANTMEVFDQNWNGQAYRGTGSPATVRYMSKNYVLGYLRPKM